MSVGCRLGPMVLKPRFQHYDWGDPTSIPKLFGFANADARPYAEAWIGAHPAMPSFVGMEKGVLLDRLLASQSEAILGSEVYHRFHCLPFMLKVIAARLPLSVQVHPSQEQATRGFRRETEAGIPLTATQRNYRDENPKPELIVALSRFQALCGFRAAEKIEAGLSLARELAEILPPWDGSPRSLRSLVAAGLQMPLESLRVAISRWLFRLRQEKPLPGTPEWWAVEASNIFGFDRGLLFVLLLNLVDLQPGEALFIPQGVPHAYLRGCGIEVLASSDNVVRGGLTKKHVDPEELLAILSLEMGDFPGTAPTTAGAWRRVYATPAREFELVRGDLGGAQNYVHHSCGPELVLFFADQPETQLHIVSPHATLDLPSGGTCLLPHNTSCTMHADSAGQLFSVHVPPV